MEDTVIAQPICCTFTIVVGSEDCDLDGYSLVSSAILLIQKNNTISSAILLIQFLIQQLALPLRVGVH